MDRQQAHQLLDQLGPAQLKAVAQLLEVLTAGEGVDPIARLLAQAPVEEEEITPRLPRPWTAPELRSPAAKASRTPTSCASSA